MPVPMLRGQSRMLWMLFPMKMQVHGTSRDPKPKKRGRPPTGVKTPWKELGLSKATYYRRIRSL